MKLSPRDAPRYFAAPDPSRAGLLIYGNDAMRVALRRQEVIAALIGPDGEAEMRLTRMQAGDIRRDAATLLDAVKAQGFFPGQRVVFVEEAADGTASALEAALAEWREGDAQIIVTAGQLKPASPLRKLFEGHPNAYAAGVYDDPPDRDEIDGMLRKAGLSDIPREAMSELVALARTLDPGELRQTLEKIALYKHGDPAPLSPEDIAACTPATVESGMDELIDIVAEGRTGELGPMVRRLAGQGVLPVTLCIGALRHFRLLHAARAEGARGRALAQVRNFKRRERMEKQVARWSLERLESAIGMLIQTDLTLRSSSAAPAEAVMERTLIRLSMLGKKKQG